MRKLGSILSIWLPIAIVTTALCGLVFAAVQQSLRQAANDPQIQLAEDAADALTHGASAESVVSSSSVDVARSLAPFITVFGEGGEVIASSGLLHGQSLQLPAGVLENVRIHGESRLTLQPEPSARIASVIVPYRGPKQGFVLAGRSLRETEVRTTQTRIFVAVTWFVALGVSLLVVSTCCSETLWQ